MNSNDRGIGQQCDGLVPLDRSCSILMLIDHQLNSTVARVPTLVSVNENACFLILMMNHVCRMQLATELSSRYVSVLRDVDTLA